MALNDGSNRELVVNPGEYAYMQDATKGLIKTHVGPIVVNQTAQEQPVAFTDGRFQRVQTLEQAVRRSPRAGEGDYIVLENPSDKNVHPDESAVMQLPQLKHGCKVNIPGPCTFALWPGQTAKVIQGHNLRSNQYLVVRVYNEDEARKNWSNAVIKRNAVPPAGALGNAGAPLDQATPTPPPVAEDKPNDLTIGKRIIIKGTEVSFYIPPTGIEVVPDDQNAYVRSAVTLERLEVAILVDEDGNKRYEKGPQVVFPSPTEEFFVDENNLRKFSAIELNHIQGLHIKVIAPYEENGKKYTEGEEIFVTGRECAIYYPRPEHKIIQYGNRQKHFAVAIPEGDGRYVMDRVTGAIKVVKGPTMTLLNPITSVFVRRVLSDKQTALWYPDNAEAMQYNRNLRAMSTPGDGESGYVAESTYTTKLTGDVRRSGVSQESFDGGMQRGTTYTKPRELTLNTKYDGVPVICPWTGYAVLVASKSGKRRVAVGPDTILLGYDETLEPMALSTGKPKTTDKLYDTAYLRVRNNKVSDIVDVHTSDHVKVNIKLSFRVNFEGSPEKWFDVENYVKFLCDHARSMLKGSIRRIDIETFYGNGVAIIRDIILGKSKPKKPAATADKDAETEMVREGLFFSENCMRVVDVEVLDIAIQDEKIKNLLENAQLEAVAGNIGLAQSEKSLKITLRKEEIRRETDNAAAVTVANTMKILEAKIADERKVASAKESAAEASKNKEKQIQIIIESINDLSHKAGLERDKAEAEHKLINEKAAQELRIEQLKAEAESVVTRFGVMKDGMAEALLTLSHEETLVKVAEAMSVQNLIGGKNVVDVLGEIFKGTNLEGIMDKLGVNTLVKANLPTATK